MKYFCDFCGKVYPQLKLLKEHIKIHTPTVAVKEFTCVTCREKFPKREALKMHWTKCKLRPYSCKVCHMTDMSYAFQCVLDRHMMLHKVHYTCHICSKILTSEAALQKHISGQHFAEMKFTCDDCGMMFSKKDSLIRHILSHVDDRPTVCAVCQQKFINHAQLTIHEKLHDTKSDYQCTVCYSSFDNQHLLDTHLQTHNAKFSCDLCNTAYTNPGSLKMHKIRAHLLSKKVIVK